ncbi:coiled-coil domain-containing protein 34 [Parambassis ranga]|uniref:Coiled-coil domain-containing protein 34 n=1 Tax=Parambassis ranga TaxID=210632 RepID=A0A6P7IE37_9TELE|nr:coiled-coil domain-containing protein 34 [Parambassis ranga]
MPGGRMLSSASNGFSSTPVKSSQGKYLHSSKGFDGDVLSDDEDTFSLLSPIYHDSFDSDEEDVESISAQQNSSRQRDDSRLSMSPVRCELPQTPSDQMLGPAVQPAASPALSAWEMWLVNKAKEDRLKMEKKADEERFLKEKKEQEERQREQKNIITEEKIQGWLKIKNDQERNKQLEKQRKDEEEMQKQLEKQREIHLKAEQKYKDWLQKKNQEKKEKEQRERNEAALKEQQEKERRGRAEEKFKDWLVKANEKSRATPKSPRCTTSPYDKSYTSPSFYNPIPWKPIHNPPPETSLNKTPGKKSQKQKKSQQSTKTAFRPSNTLSAAYLLQRR